MITSAKNCSKPATVAIAAILSLNDQSALGRGSVADRAEKVAVRHVHAVGGRAIESLVIPVVDWHAHPVQHLFGVADPL